MARLLLSTIACALAAGLLSNAALAGGGNYSFAGGTAAEQAQVRNALDASSFDWGFVREPVTIHIVRGISTSYSLRGSIWLDSDLLDAGRFSWGTVQMEYAQQVHFFLLDDAARAQLTATLGGKDWCYETPGLARGDNACERFAATLAWAYWQSPDNSMKPTSRSDWSAAMAPAKFRALASQLFAQQPAV